MKRDMNVVKQILTTIADYPTRKVPLSELKVKDLAFYLLLMEEEGYLVNQEIKSVKANYDSQVDLTYEIYMTWKGYDFLETLNKEDKKVESGADYQKDILDQLNNNIIKEIDKKEWNKVLNQPQYNFLVIEIFEDYGHMEEINYIEKFKSKSEAEAFIKDAKNKYKESFNNKYDYVKNYVTNAPQEAIDELVKQFAFRDWNVNKIDYLVKILSKSISNSIVVEGYNPPEVLPSNSQYYHILEIKEN